MFRLLFSHPQVLLKGCKCAQLPVTYNLWEGPEDDWITVETCSPIVISENKCCADVKNDLFPFGRSYLENIQHFNFDSLIAFKKLLLFVRKKKN